MRGGVSQAQKNTAKYGEHFYRRVPMSHQSYETDEAELVPVPKKPVSLSVGLAGAKSVSVRATKKEVLKFEATELPEIRFSGSIAVTDVLEEVEPEVIEETARVAVVHETKAVVETADNEDVETAEADPETVPVREDGVTMIPITHKKGRAPLHTYTKTEQKRMVPLYNPDGIIGMEREDIEVRNPRAATLRMSTATTTHNWVPVIIGVSTVAALMSAFVLLGTTQSISSDGVVSSGYTFNLESIISLIQAYLTALIVHSF